VVKAVHYLNQFFAGLGAEEAAETEPTRLDGAVGPGRGLQAQLDGVEIAATVACGDDYFGEHEDEALERLLALIEAEQPAVLVAGPAFGSGRYGYACARIVAAAAERGIPAVTAMHSENPGVSAAGRAIVVPTEVNVAGMREALPILGRLASALAAGRELGSPDEEGYLPRGFRRNRFAEQPGAERAIDLLLAKLGGEVRSEVAAGFDRVPPPASRSDRTRACPHGRNRPEQAGQDSEPERKDSSAAASSRTSIMATRFLHGVQPGIGPARAGRGGWCWEADRSRPA